MKRMVSRNWKKLFIVLAGILLLVTVLPLSGRAEEEHKVLRVAFPRAEGYTMMSPDGTRYGVVIDFLNENKIKGLILDVDNTLIDYNRNMLNGLEKWAEHMKQNNIKLYMQ